MRITNLMIAVLLILTVKSAAEEQRQCKPNACGPDGWLGYAIPDRFLGCDFVRACNQHDYCYTRCAECGDLYGTSACAGTGCELRQAQKDLCDVRFRADLISQNAGKTHCALAATAYYFAVKFEGCNYYRSLRDTLDARTEFQNNFQAALQWLEANPNETRRLEIELTLAALATLNAADENRLHFEVESGRLKVAPDKARGVPSLGEKKLLLNGVDITGIELSASPESAVRAFRQLKIEEQN